VKPLIILSIPWAISIHTVTAFIYAGLPGRGFWLTAIMAPRFLASAFASGPALLILFCLILKRLTRFDAGEKACKPWPRSWPTPWQRVSSSSSWSSLRRSTARYRGTCST